MPRARTIKPQFLRSNSMSRVSREARLTFIHLWLVADDAGLPAFSACLSERVTTLTTRSEIPETSTNPLVSFASSSLFPSDSCAARETGRPGNWLGVGW